MIDWVITNIGGTLMCLVLIYTIGKTALEYLGKLLCYLDARRLNHGTRM